MIRDQNIQAQGTEAVLRDRKYSWDPGQARQTATDAIGSP